MNSWRDQILRDFTPDVARLTVVADPDELLLEEGVLASIRQQGFELIPFEDHISFRYVYESGFRSRWDQGEQTSLVVVLRSSSDDLDSLPYDLLQAGRRLSFNLGTIFPNLSYPVVSSLDRGDLDALYEAQKRYTPDASGDNATKEFVLRHVFEIAPELIRGPADLLRVLLRRHYREQRIPALVDDRFIQILGQRDDFKNWPLERIIPDSRAFFTFLQERWPLFIERSLNQDNIDLREAGGNYELEFSGPPDLPFDHHDIRVYIDNLFLEGFLEAVPAELPQSLSESWFAIGVKTDEQADRARRVEGLLNTLAAEIPREEARHGDWFLFAKTWAELIALVLEAKEILSDSEHHQLANLQIQVDNTFTAWLTNRYAGLINLPPVPPVMLHHIPRYLARHIHEAKGNKAAFLLVDGLSLDQWIVLRKELARQRPGYYFRENAVFAWVPTITSVSRQAAFSGKPPVYFPNSIHTTDKEPALWTQFWMDQGLTSQEVAYARGINDDTLNSAEEKITRPNARVVGLVIDKVDKIMHGMELGAAGMHNQVRQWAGGSFMTDLIDLLLENGFSVHLTSDHGNIEATGCGRPAEGAVADLRGVRARIYPDHLLRGQVKRLFPDSLEWPPVGLPENYLPLLAPDRSAFIREKESIVAHGGASLKELIVPFVQIERRDS